MQMYKGRAISVSKILKIDLQNEAAYFFLFYFHQGQCSLLSKNLLVNMLRILPT